MRTCLDTASAVDPHNAIEAIDLTVKDYFGFVVDPEGGKDFNADKELE